MSLHVSSVVIYTHVTDSFWPGSELGSWHSSGESKIYLPHQDLSLHTSLLACQLNPTDIYYDIKSDDEYYSPFTPVSGRRKRNKNRHRAEVESETNSENEVETEKEGEMKGRGRGRQRKAVMKRSKSQECCSRKEVEKPPPTTTTTSPKKAEDTTNKPALRSTKRNSKSFNQDSAKRISGPSGFREKVSGILNRSAPSFSAVVKGVTDEKAKSKERGVQKLERDRASENERKDGEPTQATAKPKEKVMTYSEVVNRKESSSGTVSQSSTINREDHREDEKKSSTTTRGKDRVYDEAEEQLGDDTSGDYESDVTTTAEEEDFRDGTSQGQEDVKEARIRPIPMPFTNINVHPGRMATSSPPSPSSHSSPSTLTSINSLLPLTALDSPTSPELLQRRTRAR